MKKIGTLFFFFCCTFAAFAQDHEELDHDKLLKQINQSQEDRGTKFKTDSIYKTEKNTFVETPFLARKDFFTYDKNGKQLTQTVQSSVNGEIFTNSAKRGSAYYPNGNFKIDSLFNWDNTTKTWINSLKYNYITYDANGFNTYYEIERWNEITKVWDKFIKYELTKNKIGVQTKRLYYIYKLAAAKYLLSSVDSATVLDNVKNPVEKKSYNISWTGNTLTITNTTLIKSKFDINGNAIDVTSRSWNVSQQQYVNSDSTLSFYNPNNIYTGYHLFTWNSPTSTWILDQKGNYIVDATNDLYTSQKIKRWDATENDFYDWRVRKYFSSMLPNVSTTDAALQSSFQIAPNPTSSDLYLKVNLEKTSDIQVNVVNQLGQIVHNQHFKNIQNEQLTIPTQELSNGIYFIQIQSGDKQATKRFVKQ